MRSRGIPRFLHRFAQAGEAVAALEYAILVGVIAVAVAGALVLFSGNTETAIDTIGTGIGAVKAPAIPKLSP